MGRKDFLNNIQILTLTYNGLDKLKALHDGLARNIAKLDTDAVWYIRDNGSSDGTKEWLQEYDGPIKIKPLFVDNNRANFSQGVNSLAEMAKEDWDIIIKDRGPGLTRGLFSHKFLLLNNDIVFKDDMSLKRMLNLYNSKVNIQMVGARLLYNDTNNLQHAGVIFSDKYGRMPYHYRHKERSYKMDEKNRYFQAVTAACMLLNADEFFKLGKLDEIYNWSFEDVDLALRFNTLWKVAYCGETNIYHEESATLKKNPVNKLFLSSNVKHFKDKWFGKYEIDHDKYLKNPLYNIIK